MANIMTKSGSQDNILTYEHICDTTADMANIERRYKTLGSTCIVITGESGGLEVYIADQNGEWKIFESAGSGGSLTPSLSLHICTEEEVDEGMPNIAVPEENTVYFVPTQEEENNLYTEYIYVDGEWEKLGGAALDLSNYATKAELPTNVSDLTNDAGYLTQHQDISGKANSADLATVATSGSYNDLSNKPTIPSLSGYATETYVTNAIGNIDLSVKADKANTVLDNTLSINRKANSIVGTLSVAVGWDNTASGAMSFAEGSSTIASGAQAHAEGIGGTFSYKGVSYTSGATGSQSHSEGYQTVASGNDSHAEGSQTQAIAIHSHAEGANTLASGQVSHAEGSETQANGNSSHAEGTSSNAAGSGSHAEGNSTLASGMNSHAEGYGGTYNMDNSTYTSAAVGMADHTEGYQTRTASGQPGNHAEGYMTAAIGGASHAEGSSSTASGMVSHAEGSYTVASGSNSHAEGGSTNASGRCAHAEGSDTVAEGDFSHAEGFFTIAKGEASHVSGKWSIADSYNNWSTWKASTEYKIGDKVKVTTTVNNESVTKGYICTTAHTSSSTFSTTNWNEDTNMNYAVIVGGGTNTNNRKNIYTLDWDGKQVITGSMQIGQWASARGTVCLSIGDGSNALGTNSVAVGAGSSASGTSAIAIGGGATASGNPSIAMGGGAEATGLYSVALGGVTLASGDDSLAMGSSTIASGYASHAEGGGTQAKGLDAHSEGFYTIATGDHSHVSGRYNVEDSIDNISSRSSYTTYKPGDIVKYGEQAYICKVEHTNINTSNTKYWEETNQLKYAVIVGGGYDENNRKNIYTLDWKGNLKIKGKVYIDANDNSSGGSELISWTSASSTFASKTSLNDYALKNNTVLTGSLSLGRKDSTTIGNNSIALGISATASGMYSSAIGYYVSATADSAHAEGYSTEAKSAYSHVEGYDGVVATDATAAHVEGYQINNVIINNVEKHCGVGSGQGAHAEGSNTYAQGQGSHAEGSSTQAIGFYASHAEGASTIASGNYSHAEGLFTRATDNYAHAEGQGGTYTLNGTTIQSGATGQAAHTEGNQTLASGQAAHAEGNRTTAAGQYSHAEGDTTIASGYVCHAEGISTVSSGSCTHTEGGYTTASDSYTHAEGYGTKATKNTAHAEGCYTEATFDYAHAEGYYTKAVFQGAHAEGSNTIADDSYTHAQGEFNYVDLPDRYDENTQYHVGDEVTDNYNRAYTCIEDTTGSWNSSKWKSRTRKTFLDVVGNGDYNARSNAFALDRSGNGFYAGDLYTGCNRDSTGGNKVLTTADISLASYTALVNRVGELETQLASLRAALENLSIPADAILMEDGTPMTDEQGNYLEFDT